MIQCSPLSLLGADLIIANEYYVSGGTVSEENDPMYLNLTSGILSILWKTDKLSIFAIVSWFTSKSKEIDSLIVYFRVKN